LFFTAPVEVVFQDAESKPEPAKPLFLGLHCVTIPPALKAQLKPEDGKGVMVESVLPDSPAAQAGFQQYDILLKVGDKPLADAEALADAVRESAGKPLTLEYLRQGEKKTVAIAAAERPAPFTPAQIDQQRWLERFNMPLPGPEGDRAIRFHMVHPGIVVDRGRPIDLPGDMKVTIIRSGKDAAEITVQQGDKTWKGTSEKLDGIPTEAEAWVRRSLGLPHPVPTMKPFGGGHPRRTIVVPGPPQPDSTPEAIEKRLDETMKQLQQLQKSIEEIRKQTTPPATP